MDALKPRRFDANWGFSIPPPMVAYSGGGDGSDWCGMSNRVWGSHVYYTTVATYSARNPARNHTLPLDRPIALTKCARPYLFPRLLPSPSFRF